MPSLDAARRRLFDEIARTVHDLRVLKAIEEVPRERFVSPDLASRAYEDNPLPIGEGQTISQPLIVAIMSEALDLKGDERVLEVGTGSGYQAAVLAHLAREVVSVERFPTLAQEARERLESLHLENVSVNVTEEGSIGWPDGAPYDAILVTAAAPYVPQALLDQVKDGGRIVIPVGPRNSQELLVVTRRGDRVARKSLGGCRFVPLIGSQAWPPENL